MIAKLLCRINDADIKEACFKPHECLSFKEALCFYTVNGAHAAGAERFLGEIEDLFQADFIVVGTGVSMQPWLLPTTNVQQVFVAGKQQFLQQVSYQASSTETVIPISSA